MTSERPPDTTDDGQPRDVPAAASVPDDERAARLSAYFGEHRDRYTIEALRRAAAEAGYRPAEIDGAMPTVMWTAQRGLLDRRSNSPAAIGIAIIYVVALYGISGMSSSMSGEFGGVLFLGVSIAAAIGWATWRDDKPTLATGLGCGVVVSIALPVVLVVALLGICLAGGGTTPFLG